MLSPLVQKIRAAFLSLAIFCLIYGWTFTKSHDFAVYSAILSALVVFDVDQMIARKFERK